MTLTTHAIVGAAAASFFPTMPYAAFAAGFASHLLIDSLPHWDEGSAVLRSMRIDPQGRRDMKIGKSFVLDLLYLAAESFVGLAAGILFFSVWLQVPLAIVLVGVVAGLLPDALHFVYFKTRSVLLRDFERFHAYIQHEYTNKLYLLVEAALVAGAVVLRAAIG